jgi:thiamine kinase-like enzyme
MKSQFLTTDNFLRGKVFSVLEKIKPGKIATATKDFGKGKWIKKQNAENLTSVGVFEKSRKKVIVKHVSFRFQNLIVRQLLNEASMLTLFSKLASSIETKIAFPRVFEHVSRNKEAYLVSEYIQGPLLSRSSNDRKIEVLTQVQLALREMSENIDAKTRSKLPKRNISIVFVLFWLYLLTLAIRKVTIPDVFVLVKLFIKNIFLTAFSKRSLVLSHKDLHDSNIILGKNITVIDPEVSVLADPMTDMAHIARYYAKSMSAQEIELLMQKGRDGRAPRTLWTFLFLFKLPRL